MPLVSDTLEYSRVPSLTQSQAESLGVIWFLSELWVKIHITKADSAETDLSIKSELLNKSTEREQTSANAQHH